MKNNYQILLVFISCLGCSFGLSTKLNIVQAKPLFIADNIHDHNSQSHSIEMKKEGDHHQHKTLEISANSPIPQVEIIAYSDPIKGWNLEIKTTNFNFNPELINKDSNPNEGHAHLYINGEKVTRIYSNWFYISELPKGKNEIKVTLNTNQHEDLVYQGKIIGDTMTIDNQL